MVSAHFEQRIANSRHELCRLMEAVDAFGKQHLTGEAAIAAELAVEELIYNTILYGCVDAKPHHIHLTIDVTDGQLIMRIEDDAVPFNPLLAPDPPGLCGKPTEKEGGLGIFLVKELMDQIEYVEKSGGNLLILRKTVANN